MCPLRYVLAMLTALVLLYCLAVLALDSGSSGSEGIGDGAQPSWLGVLGAARLSAVVARARRRSCWRFTVSFFTGELLLDIWRGDASGAAAADGACDPCGAPDDAGEDERTRPPAQSAAQSPGQERAASAGIEN